MEVDLVHRRGRHIPRQAFITRVPPCGQRQLVGLTIFLIRHLVLYTNMETEKVVPNHDLQGNELGDLTLAELIQKAQESDEADRRLTFMQAVMKYKKAVFWAMFLSTSLIMEGYDLVIVRVFDRSQCHC